MMRWRHVLGTGAALIAFAPSEGASGQTRPVQTQFGVMVGAASASGLVYKGVPFAAPPVGPLRWRSPEPPLPWSGVRRADAFGPACAQAPLRGRTEVSAASREDCLYLNIWVPSRPAEKLPVMVWIHGGGFQNGSGTSATYDGSRLAAAGVIVVTINYRLGVFGFLAHPDLTAESAHSASGNFGLEDQLAALRWVAANIRALGGDPSNVTLFGQSAGGASVLNLLRSPQSRGLFKRVIVESGAARDGIDVTPLAAAERQGRALAGSDTIGALRAMDTATILQRVQSVAASGVRFGPVACGYVIARGTGAGRAPVKRARLSVLIGSNAREALSVPADAELATGLRSAFGVNVGQAMRAYGIGADGVAHAHRLLGTPAQQFANDSTFRCGSVETARSFAAAGWPTWQYQFEQFVPGKEAQGAAHSFEVPYVFGNLSNTGFSAADYGPTDRALSAQIVRYWTNFAKRGDPNGPGLPHWPRYTAAGKHYLRLSSELQRHAAAAADLRGPICRLFKDPNDKEHVR